MKEEKKLTFGMVMKKIGYVIGQICIWLFRLRSILLAIPVGYCAYKLAERNMEALPEAVGLNLLANGEYQWMVTRNAAVVGPLAITAVCLLMMFCTRKTLYPWLISVFSLVLPLLIWVTNVFAV